MPAVCSALFLLPVHRSAAAQKACASRRGSGTAPRRTRAGLGSVGASGIEKGIVETHRVVKKIVAAAAASCAAAGLRTCALTGCKAREAHVAHFKRCAARGTVVYCCKDHQMADWKAHKPACKAARKAAAEGGAGPSSA
jgi:hypothetical protein